MIISTSIQGHVTNLLLGGEVLVVLHPLNKLVNTVYVAESCIHGFMDGESNCPNLII